MICHYKWILAGLLFFSLTGCVKVDQGPYPAPLITFSNDYDAVRYFKLSRVYQDTTVALDNKVIITPNFSSLAGIKETEIILNGISSKLEEDHPDFNRERDTIYLPAQTAHTDEWVFKVTAEDGQTPEKKILVRVQ